MKKLFTLIAAVFMAANAMAKGEVDIPVTSAEQWKAGWNCDVTFSSGVITATNEEGKYGAAGYWLGDADWSNYLTLTVVLESCSSGWGQVVIKDVADDKNDMTVGFGQTSTQKEITCDLSGLKGHVKQICIQSTPGAVYKFSRVYLTPKAAGIKKALQITMTAAKDKDYDAQAFISLPQSELTAGQAYNVKMRVKASSAFDMGSQAMDDKQTAHKTQYGASAVFNYTAGKSVTTEFTDFVINCPGVTNLGGCKTDGHDTGADDHKNFAYAPSVVILSHGKLAEGGVLTVSDIQLFDKDWNYIKNIDLSSVAAYDNSKSVYYLDWQKAAKYEIIDLPLEEVTIDEALTYSSGKILNFSELTNVEAYIATAVSGSTVTMKKVTGSVPAGTGLVLKQVGENTTVFIPSCATATENVDDNKLVATTSETILSQVVGATNYVLAGTGTTLGWYSIGTTSATLAAGKAYLSIPVTAGGAKSLNIVWGEDGETTGIATVAEQTEANNGATYNVAGQRVAANAKGLVIKNGKKIFNK